MTGLTLKDISTQTGVSYVALRTRAYRQNWSGLAAATLQKVQQISTETLQERARGWTHRLAHLMERRLDYLESLDPSKLKISDLEALTRMTELTGRTARRTFGLDTPPSAETNRLNAQMAIIDVPMIAPQPAPSAMLPPPKESALPSGQVQG